MPTLTPNYGLNKPLVNDPTDADQWGTQLNSNMDIIDTMAKINSPVFTGTPSLPIGTIAVTQSPETNNTTIATTAYVDAALVANSSAFFSTTSTTTYTVPKNVNRILVRIQAGGGNGGSGASGLGSNNSSGGSGGGGAYSEGIFTVTSGQVYTVTIGATCSFGSLITGVGAGGNGGNGGSGFGGAAGAAGARGSGGYINKIGLSGVAGGVTTFPNGTAGAASFMGDGTTTPSVGVIINGVGYGSGGSGGGSTTGGSGVGGICIVMAV